MKGDWEGGMFPGVGLLAMKMIYAKMRQEDLFRKG